MPVMAKKPKKSATYHIEVEVLDELKALSEELGVRQSDIVRLAISVGVSRLKEARDQGKTGYFALAELEALKKE